MHIRTATRRDRDRIHQIHSSAFAESESEMVARLAVDLLSEETSPPTISLVAETEGDVAGHVAFSPVTTSPDENIQGYILAPLGLRPEYQKRGIGSRLVERGMAQLTAMGVNVLLVYGDPGYYNRFGFTAEAAERFVPPYRLQYPFGWQATVLNEFDTEQTSVRISCVASLSDPELW